MAFSGGTFSRTFDCTTDRDNGVKILASKFDTELDGMATGLSTCILKDGTQTCTAAIPFAEGLTVPDNKTIVLGTNSDITIQYDESTNDSLEIAANVEGAALGIVLKADQGDDNADQHKVNIADGGTLTMASKISGSFVSYLTHTPNSTVASSTTAVAGNLTVGGDLTLGSGAVISEAELEAIDGVTAGTVTASKAVIVDSNKDIASFRNVTLTGELDAGSLDVSGDADIDGTLETDALSINGTAVTATGAELNYSDTGAAVGTVVASKVVTADANKDVASFRNITLTGELDAGSLDVSGDADIDGTLEADAMTLNGTAITATATLDTGISNNNVPKFTSGVADNDFLRVDGTAIEGRSASEVLSDIAAAPAAGSSNIVTTGALNSGSITSGFGAIDNGSSNITTTGVGTFASLDISGDIDVDGTTNLDVVDIDGAVDMASTLTVAGAVTGSSSFATAAGGTFTTASGNDLNIVYPDSRSLFIKEGSTTHVTVDNAGNVGINVDPTQKLHVAGNAIVTGIARLGDGSESAPAYQFVSDTDTGIFRPASNQLAFATGGSEGGRFNGVNFLVGKTASGNFDQGSCELNNTGYLQLARDDGANIFISRQGSSSPEGAMITLHKSTSEIGRIGVKSDRMFMGSSTTGLAFEGSQADSIYPISASGEGSLRDNAIDLGFASSRFDDVFATNGTIQTSDENEKQNIAALTSAEMTAAKAISALFKTYKWKDKVTAKGDAARTHTGVVAQEVQAAMSDAGLDASKYAFWCSNTWWEASTEVAAVEAVEVADAVYDDDGNEVSPAVAAVDAVEARDAYTRIDTYSTESEAPEGATKRTRLGVRYPELLAFIGAATEQRLVDIETRLAALEAG